MGRNAGGRTGGGVSLDGADRGDIWLVDLDPIRGHEQSGTRPALVISVDALNYGPAGLLVVLPIYQPSKKHPLARPRVPARRRAIPSQLH